MMGIDKVDPRSILFWTLISLYFLHLEAESVALDSTTHPEIQAAMFRFNNRNFNIKSRHHANLNLVKIKEVSLSIDERTQDGPQTLYSSNHSELHKDNTSCPVYCHCNKTLRSVICKDTNLTWIPAIPMYTTDLKIQDANLTHINATSIRNITNIGLISLSLINCSIVNISEDAFKHIESSLDSLNLGYNQIPIDQLQKSLCIFADRNLLRLILHDMKLKHIPDNFFHGWQGSNLSYLNLNKNFLDQFSGHVVDPLHKLESLSLRTNILTDINNMESLRSLNSLDLSQNKFIKLPSFVSNNGSKLLPNLHILNMNGNNIRYISESDFRGLSNLQNLWLGSNTIKELPNNIMAQMPNLAFATFAQNSIRKLASFSFNHSRLLFLDFSSNGYQFSTADAKNIFKYCPSLTFLSLSGNRLGIDESTVKTILSPLKNLQRLLLDSTGLQFIPTTLLETVPHLTELILSGNYIANWNPDIFLPAKNLTKLHMARCHIQIMNKTSFPQKLWENFEKVNFGHNPFSCTCDLLWFRDWLDTTNATVAGWKSPHVYFCGSPKAWQWIPLQEYHPTKEICDKQNNIYVILGASLGSVFTLTVIVAVVIYRYRWYIRYFCATIKAKRRNYNRLSVNQDYTYDAFVIYSSIDRAWVIENLIPIVEYREGYKLCVQDRDFIPGRLIMENIANSMENSRKIIIILSNNFAKSEWCRWEAAMAMHKFMDTGNDMLALIMIDTISPENLTASLTQLLHRTYVDWEGMQDCQDLFWRQLLSALELPEQNE